MVPRGTVTVAGVGVVRAKLTTFRTKETECVVWLVSDPTPCILKSYVPVAPATVTLNCVPVPGVSVDGDIAQALGGAVVPATQLKVTELAYPLTALINPLNVPDSPEKTVTGEFETERT